MITKIGDDERKIWEKAYYAFRENGDTQLGIFRDAVELTDGSLMVLGGVSPLPGQGWDVLLARLDADGCLEPGCGVLNDVTELLTSTNEGIGSTSIQIYPNPSRQHADITIDIDPGWISDIHLTLKVYNMQGQLLVTNTIEHKRHTLAIPDQSGLLFVTIEREGEVLYTQRLIRL